MKRTGQFILVSISILFTLYQKLTGQHDFFNIDFFIFTTIAWIVGWQYDKARFFEKKARASEESYKKLIDSLPQPVYITEDHRLLYANHAAVSLAGYDKKEEIIGKYIFDFIVPEYKDRLLERFKLIKKEKSPVNTIEYKARRVDGSTFFFEVTSLYIDFGDKEAILSIGKDITDRKEQTERLLQKSEKLALLGQMAAGIAHEIRNPLTSIRGFIQLFKANQQKDEYFDIVLSELDRINSIVGEFLVLAKPSAAVYTERDIKVLINDVVILIGTQTILNNIEISLEFDNDLPMVSCEENQLKQVFLNLFKNAIEAMPHGGNIDVKVRKKREGQISIRISDEGVGIPNERITTLGEPFYTTKEKGTGLGLMTCYKIIESHQGILNIQSKINEGTTIEIILPSISQTLLKIDPIQV
ncbi:ATP-binding protein [Neobacillus cucumis]|uniref:histidine kinase n=1 Tax=Neobacillus cucumis TaxID=1740721 RepID=A0A2N5HV98_9BACI|nr:ATP-binding protein [Neobacillus cucumis]PLS09444.1 PAS domain-containing sensor histidine kinase [Neobacillus cucumis]